MSFQKSFSSLRNSNGSHYVNEAYQAFPEEEETDFTGSESDDEDYGTDDTGTTGIPEKPVEKVNLASMPESTPTPFSKQKRRTTKKLRTTNIWDVFRETSEDNVDSTDLEFWNRVFTVTKVIFSIILLVLVLGTALVSKSTLFVIIANILPPNAARNSTLKSANSHFRYATNDTGIAWIWSLVLIVVAPYTFTVISSTWKLIFKKIRPLELKPLLAALLVETVHSVGLSFFIFTLLPSVDPVTGVVLCMNIAILPSIFSLIYSGANIVDEEPAPHRLIRIGIRLMTLVAGCLALAFWAVFVWRLDTTRQRDHPGLLILFIVAPILVSLSWWENFVPQGDEHSRGLRLLKRQLRKGRTKISALTNLWKIIMTIGMVSLIFGTDCVTEMDCLKTLYDVTENATLSSNTFGQTELKVDVTFGSCTRYLPLLLAAVNIVASGMCYKCCVAACKILAQIPSFSLPLLLTTPVTLAFMIGLFSRDDLKMSTDCYLPFPQWEGGIEFDWAMVVASFTGYMCVVMVTNYVWSQTKERMQREDRMFVQPLYCGVLLDQSLLLNKRKDNEDTKGVDEKENDEKTELPIPENLEEWRPGDEDWSPLRTEDTPFIYLCVYDETLAKFINRQTNCPYNSIENDETELPIPENLEEWRPGDEDWSPLRTEDMPFIYLCATMWHETENEMTQILKSLFRMDEDQCARRNLQLFFGIRDPDYYEFEAHIYFDDAFEYVDGQSRPNGYVKQLIRTLDVAISSVHTFGMTIPPPSKIETPYGGRLIWQLPGGNKLIAHLKDKAKIRHRKRWSQVMYMYYFLAHKLLSMGGDKEKLKVIADNTFILALDGDVDFQPSALKLLVDRMKRNPNVGAACGRIHPIGSGPMVWYQKFEYAVSHWLQKATEHTIGCVLCSPGCFSLFRGSALMDDNIMRRYTTPPTEARHYVQYDQGEDRWLCTLMLQQGYRVEYCAASDALTYAPEGFYEFYNQRRRWTPSTMANILDLLLDWKNVTKRNNDISMLYIAYQMLLMVSSILTPGTIFLLVLGAINMAYPALSLYWALILNLVPVAIFILLCYTAKGNVQLAYAAILSTIYSLVMMLVIVGLIKQAADNGFCSVTTVFLCGVAGVFIISAFIHPQEFWCLVHGFLYFLAIPSMSMLLMLYSLGNLHVVSWGTRETPKPATAQKPAEQNKEPEKKQGAVQDWLQKLGLMQNTGKSDYMFSFGNLFRCMCCPKDTNEAEDIKLRAILDRLDEIETRMYDNNAPSHVTGLELPSEVASPVNKHFSETSGLFEGATDRENPLFEDDGALPKATPWIRDPELKEGAVEYLKSEETVFWEEMIKTYLFPLEGDKKEQEKTLGELLELRNTVCLFFLLVNAMFVLIVFSLQQVNADSGGSISISLPCADGNFGEAVEPISMAFTAVFGVLLVIQFICMSFHRMSTFLQICSITEVKFKRPKQLQGKEVEISVEKGLRLVKDMQGIKDDDLQSVVTMDAVSDSGISGSSGAPDDDGTPEDKRKKELWATNMTRRRREKKFGTLNGNFVKNFKKLQKHMEEEEQHQSSGGTVRFNEVPELIVEDDAGEQVNLQRLKTVKKKFNRFERKSHFTIMQLSRDPRLKRSILERGQVVQNRWRRAALRAKLKRASEAAATSGSGEEKDASTNRGSSKVTMVDIARLAAVADSNPPSDAEAEADELSKL